MDKSNRQVERWGVDALHEHPDQQALVGDVSDVEIEELARSIERDGLREPLHILPTGVVVAGHQRLRAVRRLGHEEVDVVVRHDLAAAGEAEVQRLLIEDNFIRRQMGPLEIGRACIALKRLERTGKSRLSKADRMAVRDRIAARLGSRVSGRTLDRYEKLLDLPSELQAAASDGSLPMGTALKFFNLKAGERTQVIEQVRDGVPAKRAIGRFTKADSQAPMPCTMYQTMLKNLKPMLGVLEANISRVVGTSPDPDEAIDLLARAANLFGELHDREVAMFDEVTAGTDNDEAGAGDDDEIAHDDAGDDGECSPL